MRHSLRTALTRLLAVLVLVGGASAPAFAQGGTTNIKATDDSGATPKSFNVGDNVLKALRIKVVGGSIDTELPAAVALTTGMTNPTVPGVAGFLMFWNGTTWDRWDGTVKIRNETVTAWSNIDLDETKRQADTGAGCLTSMVVSNLGAATIFVKVYDGDVSAITVGTTVPNFRIPVGSGDTFAVTGAFSVDGCWAYTKLALAATTDLVEDGSPGAPATNSVVVTAFLKH